MKFNKPQYINKLLANSTPVNLNSGESVVVYSIAPNLTDDELNEWAKHILAHYISANDIKNGATIHKVSEQEYIETFVLPTEKKTFPVILEKLFLLILLSLYWDFVCQDINCMAIIQTIQH